MSTTRQILEFINIELGLDIYREEVREIKYNLNLANDFYVEIDGGEYRFISSEVIWDIYVETIKEITKDCYGLEVPNWLVIDWEETAGNCFMDGYGHTFSSYDGEELEYTFGEYDYYIFRVN